MIINFRWGEIIFYSNNFSRQQVRILADVAFPSSIKAPEIGDKKEEEEEGIRKYTRKVGTSNAKRH